MSSAVTPSRDESGQICAAKPAPRLLMLDVAKLGAIFAIIWLHAPESSLLQPTYSLGFFGVPFFTMAAVFLIVQSVRQRPDRSFGAYARGRVVRLYVPFLIWTALYILLIDLKHKFITHLPVPRLEPWLLLVGSTHHLWFLPYILAASLLSFAAARAVLGRRWLENMTIVIGAAGGVSLVFIGNPGYERWTELFGTGGFLVNRSVSATPSLLLGFGLAVLYGRIPSRIWRNGAIAVLGLLLNVVAMSLMWRRVDDDTMPHYIDIWRHLGAMGWLMVGLVSFQGPAVRYLAKLGKYVFGIYLIHVGVIEGIQAVARRAGYTALPWLDVLVFVAACTISTLLAVLIGSRRWGEWLVPR